MQFPVFWQSSEPPPLRPFISTAPSRGCPATRTRRRRRTRARGGGGGASARPPLFSSGSPFAFPPIGGPVKKRERPELDGRLPEIGLALVQAGRGRSRSNTYFLCARAGNEILLRVSDPHFRGRGHAVVVVAAARGARAVEGVILSVGCCFFPILFFFKMIASGVLREPANICFAPFPPLAREP